MKKGYENKGIINKDIKINNLGIDKIDQSENEEKKKI
jgi:hypothetical protein